MTDSNEIAEKIGDDLYSLGGKWLTGAEVKASVEEDYAKEHEFDELERELGLNEPAEAAEGRALHKAASADLAARGITSPSAEDYLKAVERVTP